MASRKKKAPAKTRGEVFANDAERSKADILAVATEEFATYGLSGARVDVLSISAPIGNEASCPV